MLLAELETGIRGRAAVIEAALIIAEAKKKGAARNHFDQILKAEHLYPDHARLGLSIMLEGRWYKSSRVRALAAAYGLECKTVPSTPGEAAFGAVPVPTTTEGETLDCPAPYWLHGFEDGYCPLTKSGRPRAPTPTAFFRFWWGAGWRYARHSGSSPAFGATNPERMSVNGRGWPQRHVSFWVGRRQYRRLARLQLPALRLAHHQRQRRNSQGQQRHRGGGSGPDAWPLAFAKAAGGAKGFFKVRPDLVEAYKEGARVAQPACLGDGGPCTR